MNKLKAIIATILVLGLATSYVIFQPVSITIGTFVLGGIIVVISTRTIYNTFRNYILK